ncbi:MAG: alpha/beta hydrolase family protein [Nannocystales bacterium]
MADLETISLTTEDGRTLAGSWFPAQGRAAHTVLVLNSGTGIPRGFYRRFAAFAASRGFGVLTYDYRGIGGSAPADLRKSAIQNREWGHYDIPAAIAWATQRLPDVPLAVVGHSAGGQQLGLAHNVKRVDAALFVAVSTGYWRDMPTGHKWFTWMLWNVFVPLSRATLGYFPARRFGLGENLVSSTAAEWGSWCMEPTYMAAFFDGTGHRQCLDGRPFGAVHFDEARFPIVTYCFGDDPIATRATVPPMMRLYAEASIEDRWFEPAEVGADIKEIGHLGFFREGAGKTLWADALEQLRSNASDFSSRRAPERFQAVAQPSLA